MLNRRVDPKVRRCKIGLPRQKGTDGLVSIVSYSRLPLMIIALGTPFHVYIQWGQCPFSRVS